MSRRMLAWMTAVCLFAAGASADQRPNILWITCEDICPLPKVGRAPRDRREPRSKCCTS